jgi:choice-of-anchor A domain-containing protein
MKIFITALLASVASTVRGRQLDAAALEARWNMDEPTITYDPVNNLFTLDFLTASDANVEGTGMAEEFYDVNCKDDGSGTYTEYIIPSGITGPDGSSPPVMTMDAVGDLPQLKFTIDTQVLANDANIYEIVTEAMVTRRKLRGSDIDNDTSGDNEEDRRLVVGMPACDVTIGLTNLGDGYSAAWGTNAYTGCYPHVAGQNSNNMNGFDDGIAVFVGGDFIGIDSAEVEGRVVVLGDLTVQAGGPGNFVSVGVGTHVIPNNGVDCMIVGGDLEAYRNIQVFNQHNSWNCDIIYRGNEYDSYKFYTNGNILHQPGYDMTQYEQMRYIWHRKSQYWKTLPSTGTVDHLNWGNPTGQTTYTCSSNNEIQVFNIQPADYYKINAVHTIYFSDDCEGKTLLINIHGCGDVEFDAAAMWFKGKMGYGANGFDTCLTESILWNFPDAANVDLGSARTSEFHGSVLVGGNLEMTTSGQSGRTIVLGNVIHDSHNSGSEFHSYQFNPPMDLPDPPDLCELPPDWNTYTSFGGCNAAPTSSPTAPTDAPVETPTDPPVDPPTDTPVYPPTDAPGGVGACPGSSTRNLSGRNLIEYTSDDVGMGVMKMCVRSSLGYTSGSFQEVNFIESLITIKYDLTAGFCVASFAVEPKERLETTAAKDTYALEAWLCDPLDTEDLTAPVRTLPKRITTYDAVGGTDAFNQGALITVCVAPDEDTYSDGIRLAGLTTFDWFRDTPFVSQEAIVGGSASSNFLTSYDSAECDVDEFCHFSSILFADFYISPGEVYGSGRADLTFEPTRRQLGDFSDEEQRRQMQEAEATSPFDVQVIVNGGDDGPGTIRTAGGSSLRFSGVATAIAILAAALLA